MQNSDVITRKTGDLVTSQYLHIDIAGTLLFPFFAMDFDLDDQVLGKQVNKLLILSCPFTT